jgi:putative glutamine amidotransferase
MEISSSYKIEGNFINIPYLKCMAEFNCIPWLISSETNFNLIPEIIDKLDGLILIGGQDIHPSLYGEDVNVNYGDYTQAGSHFKRPKLFAPNLVRDKFELNLYLAAKNKKLPTIGICRGMQLINVAESGSLYQEFENSELHMVDKDNKYSYHEINVISNTLAHKIIQSNTYKSNSNHHQAVKQLGKDLIISGTSCDNVVEIIETTLDYFAIGFQSHPETELNQSFNIFKQFTNAAREYAALK